MRLIAFDPGGTTGWAQHTMFMDPVKSPMVNIAGAMIRDEFTGEHHAEIENLLFEFSPDVLIYERFDYQVRTSKDGRDKLKIDLTAKEYIGIFKLWAAKSKCAIVEQAQMKGQGGSLWTDNNLEHIGLLTYSPHINDATRQLLSYIVFGPPQRSDYLRLLRRPH